MSQSGTGYKNPGYDINEFYYELPDSLIAQHPADRRENSRLLVLDRQSGGTEHYLFHDLPQMLNPSDVLVINDTRVIPARLLGRKKETGGKIEVLVIDYAGGIQTGTNPYTFQCECLIRASKAPGPGARLEFDHGLSACVLFAGQGTYTIEFKSDIPFEKMLEKTGRVPLPPYIRRSEHDSGADDRINYQTVYAAKNGAVAAPTAGFHFSQALLDRLEQKGIELVSITLHVSYGTFMPVRVTDIRDHKMHTEHYDISPDAAEKINRAGRQKKRIVAVGTTSVRTLEYAADHKRNIRPGHGACDLFIYPGYRFKIVDAMITNFHLPKSTLLMLVSAFAGRQNIFSAYREAIEKGYRFFSYGDAMLIH
ncbi:MAG: tRNA preQ1(34) S-adenosylmethionine ribosyltransferase-isomerase QueA [Desulfobacteraceae bacterium]|nr:tRNA preQ1(34) S-adenosylmethionine ribosyltransferase-isomerase QueA [Desulfobacteraceae bacterium]